VSALFEPFELRFMQLALAEVALLSVLAGVLGTHIVLRRLAFFTHGTGTAAFPGLVAAGPLGVPPALAALAAGTAFAAGFEPLTRRARLGSDAATALLLVGALALGAVLASDVFESPAGVDRLLFGSLLAVSSSDLVLSGGIVALALAAQALSGRAWVAGGFDGPSGPGLGLPTVWADRLLTSLIALAVVASLDAVGALLVSAILVIPAATARLLAGRVRSLRRIAFSLALAEGVAGLWIAYQLDAPPGPVIALLGASGFALVAVARHLRARQAVA